MVKKIFLTTILFASLVSCKKSVTNDISDANFNFEKTIETEESNLINVGDYSVNHASFNDDFNINESIKKSLSILNKEFSIYINESTYNTPAVKSFHQNNQGSYAVSKTILETEEYIYSVSIIKKGEYFTTPILTRNSKNLTKLKEILFVNLATKEKLVVTQDEDDNTNVNYYNSFNSSSLNAITEGDGYHPTYNWQGVADCIQHVYAKKGFWSVALFIATAYFPPISVAVALGCLADNLPTGGR